MCDGWLWRGGQKPGGMASLSMSPESSGGSALTVSYLDKLMMCQVGCQGPPPGESKLRGREARGGGGYC